MAVFHGPETAATRRCEHGKLGDEYCAACAGVPGYWMNETSGVLRPAIEAYLAASDMKPEHIVAMRAYLRQWINGDFRGWRIAELRREVELLTNRSEIDRWLSHAADMGVDPL